METNEVKKAQILMKEHIDYLCKNNNNYLLLIGVMCMIPILVWVMLITQNYLIFHPEWKSFMNILCFLGVSLAMISVLFILPLYNFRKKRNKEVVTIKHGLLTKLQTENISYEDFKKEVLEIENSIYLKA